MAKSWAKVLCAVIYSLAINHTAKAQTAQDQLYIDHDTYVDLKENISFEVDNSFFSTNLSLGSDTYEELNRYLYTPISTKRRGVGWWQVNRTLRDPLPQLNITQPTADGSLKIFASTHNYRVGAEGSWSRALSNGWGVSAYVSGRTGRDMSVEGVFLNQLTPSLTLTKEFTSDHILAIDLSAPYQMRGLRSSATQEAYDLTHNNLYNPSWGYYHGEVRNSRVVRNFLPTLSAQYFLTISSTTTLTAHLEAEYGTRKLSRLGWYDTSNPTPNYYSKLPSYFEGSEAYDQVVAVWQQNDSDYTQVAWDKLEAINSQSTDGESLYVVEDQVERVCDIEAHVLMSSTLSQSVVVGYGLHINSYNHRNYKQMRDLLSGEYLLDMDQYAGDDVQVGNEMQNNLRDPNRKITQGDRFSYDYDHRRRLIEAMAKINYRGDFIHFEMAGVIGNEYIYRTGHYEKERFSGAGSYGDSPKISLPTYNLSVVTSYAIAPQQTISLRANISSTAPLSRYLFVAPQYSNTIIDNPTTEKIASASIAYNLTTPYVNLSIEGYILCASDMGEVWQGYDDLSSTYCDVVISDIATRSMGVEASCEVNVGRNLKLTSTLAFGGYTYTSAPLVTLYNDVDMSIVSQSQASAVKGFIVGNAPQIVTTAGATYFSPKGFIVDADLAYYAQRYIAPSITRRTNRILSSATSVEGLAQMIYQERLPNTFNASIAIIKNFSVGRNNRLTAIAKVDNILGSNNTISSAREGNRVLSSYSNSVTYSYTPQSSTYQYAVGRTLYLSLKYRF
ncbi:MAG: hypothetical protein SNG02_03095 [Rikenellaceae bacterium]